MNTQEIASIGSGITVFLGVELGDTEKDLQLMAKKISGIRIFEDSSERMTLALDDNQEILLISQFTILGRLESGFRPDFTRAEKPELAREMIEKLCSTLRGEFRRKVQTGQFGADMEVNLSVDGPVTILFDTRR